MNDHIWDINKVTNKLNHIKKDLQDYDKKYKGIIKNIYEKDNTNITKEYLSDVFTSNDEIEFCIYNKAYKQLESIKPWIERNGKDQKSSKLKKLSENKQDPKDRSKLDGKWECVLCFCCTTSCPSYWWNDEKYLGPAVLLQASRWINDSRDTKRKERLRELDDSLKLYRCHSIMSCTSSCPKGLNPAKEIADIKKFIVTKK